jgi:hypothetical protein
MYVNFWIRKDHLEMKVQMRSNDIFFGLTYDAPWFSSIHQSMYLNLKQVYPDLKLGVYYHSADNIHFYERHFEVADKILDEGIDTTIKLRMIHPLFRFVETATPGKHGLVINEEAVTYLKIIDDIIDSEEDNKDKNFWKSTLGYLYEITGDNLDNQ